MNTIENLTREYGFDKATARMMVKSYEARIGSRNGDYEITDITFCGENTKEAEMTCVSCGDVLYRRIKKWDHLRKTRCKACQTMEREERETQKERERDFVIQNEIGKRYGDYEIYDVTDGFYKIRCIECGHEDTIFINSVLNGRWKDQKCHKHRGNYVEKYDLSYIGKKNNRLTVIDITHNEKTGRKEFVCKCDCGKTYRIKPTLWENGKVKSCGCYQSGRAIDADPIKRIKAIHNGMKNRCLNEKDRSYGLYGGRGVKICSEWLEFDNFLKWSLENGYDNTRTIDRIDSNGNYEPDNCRWATYYVQNRNKRPRKSQKAVV